MGTELATTQSNKLAATSDASKVGVAEDASPTPKSTTGKFSAWIVKCIKSIKNRISIVFNAILTVITLGSLRDKKVEKIDAKFLAEVASATDKLINKIDEIISKDDTIKPEKIMQELQLKSSVELLRKYENEPTESDVELIYQAVLTESFFEIYSQCKLNAKKSKNCINNKFIPKIVSEQINKIIDKTESEKIKQDLKAKLISETEIAKPLRLDYSTIYSHTITTEEQRNDLISYLVSRNIYNSKANEVYGLHSISPNAEISTFSKMFSLIKYPITLLGNRLKNKSQDTKDSDDKKG